MSVAVQRLRLNVLPGELAICRLSPDAAPPDWAWVPGPLAAVSRTAEELSIVCAAEGVPPAVQASRGWRTFKVAGPLDFALTGILARLAVPLAEAGISLFAVSTYDTDYLLVREAGVEKAVAVLRRDHEVLSPQQ